jgi:hypothetical protein
MDVKAIRALIQRWFAQLRGPDRPIDPHAYVRQPRQWPPGGRSSAATVDEPDEPLRTHAAGSRHVKIGVR